MHNKDGVTKLPNSKYCFACGLENSIGLKLTFYALEDGSVEGHYRIPKQFEGYPGIAHGGIIASILDEAVTRAFMVADHNRFMYTGRLTMRIRKHVPVEQELHITSQAIRDRGRTAEAKAQVRGPEGEVLAEAEALLVALAEGELTEQDREDLGWRVYADEEGQG